MVTLRFDIGSHDLDHIMLATVVALSLEGNPVAMRGEPADPIAVPTGMNLRHILSIGLTASTANASDVPFNTSRVYADAQPFGEEPKPSMRKPDGGASAKQFVAPEDAGRPPAWIA
jgi:hypothetical protein